MSHLGEVHLLGGPEAGLRLLVHLPDGVVLYWQDDEPPGILLNNDKEIVYTKKVNLVQKFQLAN